MPSQVSKGQAETLGAWSFPNPPTGDQRQGLGIRVLFGAMSLLQLIKSLLQWSVRLCYKPEVVYRVMGVILSRTGIAWSVALDLQL